MERAYKTLFDLSMVHDFYDDKKANDFVFVPSKVTALGLKKFRLLSNTVHSRVGERQSHQLTISYPEVNSIPFIPINLNSNPSLVFGILLENSNFFNYTSETASLKGDEVFYFTNVTAPDVLGVIDLVRTRQKLRRKVFTYSFKLPNPFPVTATIKILDALGVEIPEYTQVVVSDNGDFNVLINLEKLPDDLYQVSVISGGMTISTDNYYLNDDLAILRPFGVLDIRVTSNNMLSVKKLEINFTARNTAWKYFVVFEVPLVVADIIEVGQGGGGLDFSEVIAFGTPERAGDKATKESLELRYPGRDVRLYESNVDVDYKETIKTNIKLKKNTQPLIQHLPGPSLDSVKAESYIFI